MEQQDQSSESNSAKAAQAVDSAVAEGGAYEVIRKRLVSQGAELEQQVRSLNESRLAEFGSSNMQVQARVRIRTENNCVARDIVQVGDYLLFGYNVFIGLKREIKVEDVFALFTIGQSGKQDDAAVEFTVEPVDTKPTFLSESAFVNDFDELYRYYKHTRLIQLSIINGKLLAGFQIGEKLEDIRVFRWSVSADGKTVKYIDNRGERDIQLPPAYDFDWIDTLREDTVNGRHAHVNILDTVFIETIGGDLTIKIENNTEDGLGIYREPVEDKTQALDDAQICYAAVGRLILLKIRPYKEELWRYFIYNTLTQTVLRIDAIGESCVQLPEEHGVIFPGGYYLQTGEFKTYDEEVKGLLYKRMIRSPNGEDVLYVFYEPDKGIVGLFAYNLIEKQLQNPVYGHGYALAENGQLIIFSAENEPTRVHPMQIWTTPYESAEFASKVPDSQTFLGRVGNSELVRGVSDLYSICRIVSNQSVSLKLYEELSQSSKKIFDDHYWLDSEDTGSIAAVLKDVSATAELVIDEFEKVESIRKQSARTMQQAEQDQTALLQSIRPDNWEVAEDYVNALGQLRRQRGHLTTIKTLRYIDVNRIEELGEQLESAEAKLSEQTVVFLSDEAALEPYMDKIEGIGHEVEQAKTIANLTPIVENIVNTAAGLDLLSELMGTLKVEDATVRTRIIDAISQVYSVLNQTKATAKIKQKSLGSKEAVAQFGAQFKLFSQSITNALGMATTPEKCDEQLSRLLVQLEELESQFSDFDQFLADIIDKREEIYESFENHKQQLLDQRQRRAQTITDAADRILKSIEKRSLKYFQADELNTYFASDALVLKVRDLVAQLRELDSAINADDIDSRFKAIQEQSIRALRDKNDIFEEGGNIIKLGPRHKFSVNTQELDLTIIPRDGELTIHLTGTHYYESIADGELQKMSDFWDMPLASETPSVYRAEYLAASIIEAAESGSDKLSMEVLRKGLLDEEALENIVRDYANPRYKEGYEKGVHDHDATLLLKSLLPAMERADLLRFDPLARALAQIFWANIETTLRSSKSKNKSLASQKASNPIGIDGASAFASSVPGDTASNIVSNTAAKNLLSYRSWQNRAQSAAQMQSIFASPKAIALLESEVKATMQAFVSLQGFAFSETDIRRASAYLVAELSRERLEFIGSKYAGELVEELKRSMDEETWRHYQASLEKMRGWPAQRWQLSSAWLQALVDEKQLQHLQRYIPEAVAQINAEERIDRRVTEVDVELKVAGLLGDHVSIQNRQLDFALDEFMQRLEEHRSNVVPDYHRYLQLRQNTIADRRATMRLEEFKARPLSSFVRNRLINESYLPLIGDNLAKQMGTVGENKRTDLMGLLMMISPPGYGKTTLMEYVASRLGLIFMKINCPSLGHDVYSLDPEQAPNATARQELNKLNLALEMGNNVMLYLDDIQHTHAEFLQKFISLCDGTRRIEGVWQGQTKTYDMRGRKFCVVMAGNPYTESGEAFKVPDMLANRADIYNLGDILGGMDEQFALSYVENSMTSNPILAPLALRDMDDIYKLIEMAKGAEIASSDLKHQYSAAEINEIIEVFKKLFVIQDVVLKINQQYIASAAQNDKYRIEPPFKLQGSYRNMNKMTEKVSAVMNQDELMQMIADHYLGEAQLLTQGAEDNLLKLAELRGNMTEQEQVRWTQIKADFLRNKAMGGDSDDIGAKVIAQLVDLVSGVQQLKQVGERTAQLNAKDEAAMDLSAIESMVEQLAESLADKPNIEVINQPVPGLDKILSVLADTLEHSISPLVKSMDKKLEIDLRTHEKMVDLSAQIRELEGSIVDNQPPSSGEASNNSD